MYRIKLAVAVLLWIPTFFSPIEAQILQKSGFALEGAKEVLAAAVDFTPLKAEFLSFTTVK